MRVALDRFGQVRTELQRRSDKEYLHEAAETCRSDDFGLVPGRDSGLGTNCLKLRRGFGGLGGGRARRG